LLGQAAQSVARSEEQWRQQYAHLALRRNHAIAKVAMARKLAVRLFWMWRRGWDYQQLKKFGSQARKSWRRKSWRLWLGGLRVE
jgi:transposase